MRELRPKPWTTSSAASMSPKTWITSRLLDRASTIPEIDSLIFSCNGVKKHLQSLKDDQKAPSPNSLYPWLLKLTTYVVAHILQLFSNHPWEAVYYLVNGKIDLRTTPSKIILLWQNFRMWIPICTYMGDEIENRLRWKEHINHICNTTNRLLDLIRRNVWFCTDSIKMTVYVTLVRPKLV